MEWIQNSDNKTAKLQNSEITKQRNYKTAKNKMENNKTENIKTATITKQRTVQNREKVFLVVLQYISFL